MVDILECVSVLLFLIYLVISAVKSKKQGVALYKHVLIRISLFAIPFAFVTSMVVAGHSLSGLNIDASVPSGEFDKVVYLFFTLPGLAFVGVIKIIIGLVVFFIFALFIGILWIIYAVAKGVEKSEKSKSNKPVIVSSESDADNSGDI